MKVKILQCFRGPGVCLDPGDIHEGDSAELVRWCARGLAEPITQTMENPEDKKPKAKARKKRKAIIE